MVHLFKKRNQKSTPISGRALAGIVLIGRESVGVVWFICGLLRKVWCRCKRWIQSQISEHYKRCIEEERYKLNSRVRAKLCK